MLPFDLILNQLICDKFIIEQNFYGIINTYIKVMIFFQMISPTLFNYLLQSEAVKKFSLLWMEHYKQY